MEQEIIEEIEKYEQKVLGEPFMINRNHIKVISRNVWKKAQIEAYEKINAHNLSEILKLE